MAFPNPKANDRVKFQTALGTIKSGYVTGRCLSVGHHEVRADDGQTFTCHELLMWPAVDDTPARLAYDAHRRMCRRNPPYCRSCRRLRAEAGLG